MRLWGDKQNLNGRAPGGPSSGLVTRDDSDNVLHALPAGAGGIGAQFRIPPPPVAGLAFDLNADTISGADGSIPAQWIDSSGANAVATATGSPVLKTGANGISGHSVVRFVDAAPGTSTTFFSLPIQPAAWQGLSVYYVARSGSGSANTQYGGVFGWPQLGGSWLNLALGSATGQGAGWAGPTGNVPLGSVTGYAPRTTFYGSYRYDKAHWTIDGVETATVADSAWITTTSFNALIGANTYGGSQSDNDIARILVYNRKLSDAEDARVKAYLQYTYGLASAPGRELSVGYPETITNFFAIRYVHPAGNDANDGKTWQTAKATVLAAWDAAVAEVGANGVIELHVHDLSYMGGEVANNGLWLDINPALPGGAGWRVYHPHRIIGHGGLPPGRGNSRSQARIYQGNPRDSQAFDKTKPLIWLTGGETESTIENIRPVNYGFARIAVIAAAGNVSTTRDGNVANLRWTNVYMLSPPDTSPVYGPCYDCGWLNVCWFTNCQAFGSATMRPVALAVGDNSSGGVFTLANAAFSSPQDVDGWIQIDSGPLSGQWFITSILSPTQAVMVSAAGAAPANHTFSTETIEKAPGPYILDDDNHAGWLVRPTDPDASGQPGSQGEVYWYDCSYQQCGIKAYPGNDGEIGVFSRGFISEGGPMPHPIQIRLMPGASLPSLGGSNTQIEVSRRVLVADGAGADGYYVYIDEALHDLFAVGTVKVEDMQSGQVFGPCLWSGNDSSQQLLPTTPTAQRQYGWFHDGTLTGRHDAAARLGVPGTALPSSSGSTGNHVTNLLSHDPATWSGPATHYTAGIQDVFGLSNAGKIDALSSGSMSIPQSTVAPLTTTLSAGDFLVAGVWVRATNGPNTTLASIVATGASPPTFDNLSLHATWRGNAEWEFFRAYTVITGAGTASFSMNISATPVSALEVAYPVLRILRVSDGYTKEEAAAATDTLHSWNPLLAQGVSGTFRGQPFVASGGFGIGAAQLLTPSGTATNDHTAALLSDDGRTIQGYVPVLPTNSALPSGTVTVVGAAAPITSTGGTAPVIGLNYNTTNFHVNGFNELERQALTGDATSPAGSNTVTIPTKGKVLASSSDVTPDYLSSKIVSGGGTITVGTVGGGTQVTLDRLPDGSVSYCIYNIAFTPSLSGWLMPNDRGFLYGTPIEMAFPFVVKHVTLSSNLMANGIPVGPGFTVVVTRNGSNIVGAVNNFSSTSPLGALSSSAIATGSTAASDTYGIFWGSGPGSGTCTVSFTLYVDGA